MPLQDYLNTANNLLDENDYAAALTPLKQAFTLAEVEARQAEAAALSDDCPRLQQAQFQFAQVSYLCAKAYLQIGQPMDAKEYALLAIEFASDISRNYLLLAEIYFNLNRMHRAIEHYNHYIERRADVEASVYNSLGNAYFSIQNYPEAIGAYKNSIELDADVAMYYSHLANTYVQTNDIALALNCYDEAIELDPDWVDYYYARAELHLKNTHLIFAVRDWMRIIELDVDQLPHIQAMIDNFPPNSSPDFFENNSNQDDDNAADELQNLQSVNEELQSQIATLTAENAGLADELLKANAATKKLQQELAASQTGQTNRWDDFMKRLGRIESSVANGQRFAERAHSSMITALDNHGEHLEQMRKDIGDAAIEKTAIVLSKLG